MPENEQPEAVFLAEWPETVDPSTLFFDDGTVNIDAVSDYLATLRELNGPVDEKEPTELEQTTLNQYAYDITVPIDDTPETFNQMPDPITWRETNPIDYAITMYIRQIFIDGIQRQFFGVSETIKSNPEAKLDFNHELERFFGEVTALGAGGFDLFESAQAALGEPKNDVNELETLVAIPVAGHQEHGNIYHSLEQFTHQTLDPKKFEVCLYLNLPGREGEKDDFLLDNLKLTQAEIDRFKQDYPDIQVRSFSTTYRGDPPTIGAVRADLWTTIAYDMKKRGREDDIMVISGDADIVSLNSTYLTSMVDTFQGTEADIVTADLRWQPAPGLPYNAMVNRILRYQSFLDIVRDTNSHILHTADANTGISLAAYMAVGGYSRANALGEMHTLVNRIRYYRQPLDQREVEGYEKPDATIEAKAKGAVLRTHSRRLIKAMALGYSPYNAWDQKIITFGGDDSLRTEDMQVAAAEASSQVHAKEWIASMTGPYVSELDPEKKRRMLKAAHRILRFDELYVRD